MQVAVKGLIGLFNGTNTHLDPIRKIAREVRVSRQVDHPHVIKLIDAYVPPSPDFDHVYLIFEHMEKSLWKVRTHTAQSRAVGIHVFKVSDWTVNKELNTVTCQSQA